MHIVVYVLAGIGVLAVALFLILFMLQLGSSRGWNPFK